MLSANEEDVLHVSISGTMTRLDAMTLSPSSGCIRRFPGGIAT